METTGTRRSYDTAQRRLQSAASRQRIVDEARKLFLIQGYRTTTIADIADAAGVNPDTVYRLVGRKPMVLRELIEQALSGTDHAVAGADRSHVRAMATEPDRAGRSATRFRCRAAPACRARRASPRACCPAPPCWRRPRGRSPPAAPPGTRDRGTPCGQHAQTGARRSLGDDDPICDDDDRGGRHRVGLEQC